MNADTHSPSPEELMSYLDGELTGVSARDIHAHLAGCAACQRIAGELKNVSGEMRHWQIDEPPATLSAPQARFTAAPPLRSRRFHRPRTWQLASAAVVLIAAAVAFWSTPKKTAPAATVASEIPESAESAIRPAARAGSPEGAAGFFGGPQPPEARSVTQPAIIRTAFLRIVTAEFDSARQAIERILRDSGGFVGQIHVSDRVAARYMRATLRVPAHRLQVVSAGLRQLGRVTEESEGSEDVTGQAVDVQARLSNARRTEKRLADILQNRTGRVADILEVEREMARVRTEIERLEAQRGYLEHRVAYASLTLEVAEERKAGVDLGPIPLHSRVRHAFADGFESAISSVVTAFLVGLRAGPTLLVWGAALGLPAWWFLRRRRRRLPAD